MYKELEQQLNRAFPVAKMESEYEYDSADFVAGDDSQQPRPEALPFAALSVTTGSTTDEPSPEEEDYARQYTSRLPTDQPLYQIYMLAEHDKLFDSVLLRSSDSACGQEEPAMESTATVDLFRRESCASSDSGRGADCSTSASALTSNTSMRRERLIATSHFGSQRSLWCELEEVRAAGLLNTLDEETKMRQEAYFEVITSEASYLRSLNILITHFMASQELMGSKSSFSVISNSDRKQLFSNIFAVRDCSERLLSDLETRLEHSLVLDDLCGILLHHFETNFDVYIKYCSNQVYQERTLRRLKAENPAFLTAVSRMEADKQCQGLDMRSFLMLPMQRVTRYPLLVYAILDRLKRGCDEYEVATKALHAANRVVGECNEGARRMERTEQLLEVDSRLIYKDPDLKKIALVSNCRYLVKRGSLVQLMERKNRNILQGKQKTRNVYIFLFSDIILVTKKKLNGTYECKDYAARRYIDVQPLEVDPNRMTSGAISSLTTRPHLFLCVFMRNARGRQTELLLNAESETDRERWLSALRPPISANPEEKIYAEWDCPQAVAVHTYNKNQDDELSLEVGDMVNILRKMPDGWFFGEKTNDGQSGWFPSSYVQQILNDHAAGSVSCRESPPRSSATPLMDRLRRMSNPRFLFQADPASAL
ncbi:RhoGEF domain protein [Ancylostoma duodenale]|uniref:RhoGEF domain protein n=1 Tax=Ancylostoma duodenale TaxID=51022 RepID=A0A0C2GSP8_9BILA|nr:RhoGEF domain protein [Ancylostoma duodenale]